MLAEVLARFLKAHVISGHVLRVILHEGCPRLTDELLLGLGPQQLCVVVAAAKEQVDEIIIGLASKSAILRVFFPIESPQCLAQWRAVIDHESV